MSRTKKIISPEVSWDTYQDNLKIYAQAEAESRKINAQIDLDILKIKDKYARRLDGLSALREESFSIIQQYCEENKSTLFPKKKSLDTPYGQIGFRSSPPKLKTLKGYTWGGVLEKLKALFPEYVRVKEEPNKESLLGDREILDLATVGLEVVSEEAFYIETKEEENKTV